MKNRIKIQFRNGLTFSGFKKEVFDPIGLSDLFDFEESEIPDFIVFGPYGNDVPEKGNYIRIGYYCENFTPDLTNCEWAFGVPREEEVNHIKYQRIKWHGLNPDVFVKKIDVEKAFAKKTKFCNFLYSNQIPHREEFFKQLSKYKKVDAPGKSMNNMPAIDNQYQGDTWEIKRQFLNPYKFTIAFESYSYPGYQTEKLYDAMQMNSIPIYCGDTNVGEVFNKKSFIDAADYISPSNVGVKRFLEKKCQYTFKDYLPGTYDSLYYKIRRKLKTYGKVQKMYIQLNKYNFSSLIDKIIELDKNPQSYLSMLKEPWLHENKPISKHTNKNRWLQIFNGSI